MSVDENGYVIEPEELELEPESSYFVVLTSEILYDRRINEFQKLLFAAVSGLCRKRGYCWAPNKHFEKLFDKSETQVSQGISKLVELGYLKREIIYKKKYDIKKQKYQETKQIAFRKLMVVINHENTPILENQHTGILENQKEINNNIINNISISKDIEVSASETSLSENKLNNNKDIKDKLNREYLVNSDTTFSNTREAQPGELKEETFDILKDKKGLGPLLNITQEVFPRSTFPDLYNVINNYLHAYIGHRHLPTPEKWKEMLNQLVKYSSISLPGTEGNKFIQNKAMQIVEKALNGKNGNPFTEFDDPRKNNNVMEPHFNLNQDFTKGY